MAGAELRLASGPWPDALMGGRTVDLELGGGDDVLRMRRRRHDQSDNCQDEQGKKKGDVGLLGHDHSKSVQRPGRKTAAQIVLGVIPKKFLIVLR